jgi:hypothetical protein
MSLLFKPLEKTGSFFLRFEIAAVGRHGFVVPLPAKVSVQGQFAFAD